MGGGSADDVVRLGPVHLRGPLPEIHPPPKTPGDELRRLEVDSLTYRYADTGRGVEEVDLELDRGSFIVVTGRIGSGKTTLLRSILGLLPASSGEVRWNGAPVADAGAFMIPPRCAYTPQVPRLFSDTIRSMSTSTQPFGRPFSSATSSSSRTASRPWSGRGA